MHRAHAKYAATAPPESESALIARYGALIDRAARRVAARTAGAVAPDDLWSAGALGLLDAARRFDAARDVRFETFAEHRIRGAMLDELRRMDHLPRRLRAQVERVERTRTRLGQTLQREPTLEELGRELQLEQAELDELVNLLQPPVALLEQLASPEPPSDAQAEHAELLRTLTAAAAELPERLQILLSLHYVEGLTYREIARILDVSEPRVCQLHGEAMARLRAALGER